jgi:hypothetical protein
VPATPSTPAPVETPAKAPPAPTASVIQEPAKLEYQTLMVEQILNKFQAELKRCSRLSERIQASGGI